MNSIGDQHSSSPSSISSPRGGTFSSTSTVNGSTGSFTSYGSSVDGAANSPDQRVAFDPIQHQTPVQSFNYTYDTYNQPHYEFKRDMNATQSYGSHPHHGYMDSHQAHMAGAGIPASLPQYSHYPSAPMQPPMPGYGQPASYHYGAYGQPVSAQQAQQAHHAPPPYHHPLPVPSMAPVQQTAPAPATGYNRQPDQTGQVCPPGHKPKLTGTVWEDEGTICFQVEVRGICVARREDNCFINGTKLLNVAHMTRGRRDGILKSEKQRHVIKIGPMHLKGVWIPFERALEFANKEKIAEELYPLFVNNIGPLLTPHMQNNLRQQRDQNQANHQMRNSSAPQTSQAQLPAPTGSSVSAQQTTNGRTNPDRGHAFPLPSGSNGSNEVMGMSSANGSYDSQWASTSVAPTSQALPLGSESKVQSLPSTPTTTSPANAAHGHYQSHFEPSRGQFASAQTQPGQQYYGQSYAVKHDMAPPSRAGDNLKDEDAASYSQEYGYTHNPSGLPSVDGKSPPHDGNGSGRATPRSLATPQPQWPGYTTPQRSHQPQMPSSSLTYGGSSVASNNYAVPTPSTAYSYTNGSTSIKRSRDDDEDDPYARPASDADALKRRKTTLDDGVMRPRHVLAQRQ